MIIYNLLIYHLLFHFYNKPVLFLLKQTNVFSISFNIFILNELKNKSKSKSKNKNKNKNKNKKKRIIRILFFVTFNGSNIITIIIIILLLSLLFNS